MFTRPRYIPFWIMAIGVIGAIVFALLSRLSSDSFDNAYKDELMLSMYFGCLGLVGFVLCLITNVWILTAAIVFLRRRKHPKQT
jgi:hypothetical protein